jgi:hypothetical protein
VLHIRAPRQTEKVEKYLILKKRKKNVWTIMDDGIEPHPI